MEELTAEQQAEILRLVRQSCAELEQLLESSGASSKPVDLGEPIGRLSRVNAMQQQQMAVANRQAQIQRLQLLQNAQLAITRNQYGNCRRCEEPIGFRRLKAQPESSLCLDCQSRAEKS